MEAAEEQFTNSEPQVADVVQRNITALLKARKRAEEKKTLSDRIADSITVFSGSMVFVYLHVAWFAAWIVVNLDSTGLPVFDPYPFGLLTMIVSLEAIFLSTFVLISQNRQAVLTDRRADLDVQIDLLAEHEVTQILSLVTAIASKMDVRLSQADKLIELQKEIEPDALLEELEKRERPGKSS